MKPQLHLVLILYALMIQSLWAQKPSRIAFCVGVETYPEGSSLGNLACPRNDAKLIASALEKCGFEVITALDPNYQEFEEKLELFHSKLSVGGDAVFYFSGHGMQWNGKNYLFSSNAKFKQKYKLGSEALEASSIMMAMSEKKVKNAIAFLDCCRTPPAQSWLVSKSGNKQKGLGAMQFPNVLINYAAASNAESLELKGARNSFYAAALYKGILSKKELSSVLKNVTKEVSAEVKTISKGETDQTPYLAGSLKDDFWFSDIAAERHQGGENQMPPSTESNLQTRLKWQEYMLKMEADYAAAEKLGDKAAWDEFLASYKAVSNPFSLRDEQMLSKANDWSKLSNVKGMKAGERREYEIFPGEKVAFRWIPATGEKGFLMGSPEGESEYKDETQHKVILSKGYWMAETETTQGQWEAVMGNNPSYFKNAGKNAPVESVSYKDIEGFITKVNDSGKLLEGMEARLPTEAEWEYACRAGISSPFHTGGNLTTDQANYRGYDPYNGAAKGKNRKSTIAVGSLSANAWGLHDMHGNVMEWCSDWYGEYKGGTERDPTGANSGNDRVLRGGGWNDDAENCRSASRSRNNPSNRYDLSGFRLVIQVQ